MFGWLPRLITLLIVITVIVPFSTMILGLLQWYLCFLPLAVALALCWLYEVKRQKERETKLSPEVTSEERRNRALDEWISLNKKESREETEKTK